MSIFKICQKAYAAGKNTIMATICGQNLCLTLPKILLWLLKKLTNMRIILIKAGLFLSLAFFSCSSSSNKNNDKIDRIEIKISGSEREELELKLSFDNLNFASSLYNSDLNAEIYVSYSNVNRALNFSNITQVTDKIIVLDSEISTDNHHFFGDINGKYIYSTSIEYDGINNDGLFKYSIENGTVDKYPLQVDFTDYGERFGRSLIAQFARNDTFILGYSYPYIKMGQKSYPDIWDVPHLGLAYLHNDSIKFIKGFGFQRPNLASDYIWKHPMVSYVPEKNEFLFAYYWSDEVLVYDFKGNLKRKMKTTIEGYDRRKMMGTNYKSGCFGTGEWDTYMHDSVLYFNTVGYIDKYDLYFRTINHPANDSRSNSGIIFFDEDGNILFEFIRFQNNYGVIKPCNHELYEFSRAYDSLNYRVIKYYRYEYPPEMNKFRIED